MSEEKTYVFGESGANSIISALAPMYIKKSYSSDPFFANSKIIYSIYKDNFECPIKEGFEKRALFNGIEEADTELLVGPTLNTETLHKMAVNFSDAVINASDTISEELELYIKGKNIPYLPYAEENTHENYWNFFTQIYPVLNEENND